MTKYEYKTIKLRQKGWGFRAKEIPDLESTLNREGKEGWRLCEVIKPSSAMGESVDVIIIVFERELVESADR